MFTLLPELGVGAVRFAPLADQSMNTTPGLPVIKDDGPSVTMDHQVGPASCDHITSPPDYDYLDCGKPVPSGSPAKIWPVIASQDATWLAFITAALDAGVPPPAERARRALGPG